MMKSTYLKVLVLVGIISTISGFLGYFLYTRNNKEEVEKVESNSNQTLVATPSEYDWGNIPINAPISKDIVLRNKSDETITIQRISTSCACTDATFENDLELPLELSPNAEKNLKVTFDPTFHEDQPLGDITREVYIKYGEAGEEELSVRFTGTVIESN